MRALSSLLTAMTLSLLWATGATAQAQQDTVPPDTVYQLEELLVEVSRLRVGGVPLARTPLSAQLLQAKQIERSAHSTIAEAMGSLPGVSLGDQFGSPFQPDLRLRGFTLSPIVGVPQSLSVFVDGVRVNEADASQVHFDLIPMDEVERIEVIRGPVGPFGRNTLAGALNIVTRRGDGEPTALFEASGGYFEEFEGRGRADGRLGDFDFYAAGRYFRTDGWRQKNYAEQRQAFAKLGWRNEDTDAWISYTFALDSLEGPQALPLSWLQGGPLPDAVTNPPEDRRKLRFTGGLGDSFKPELHFFNGNLTRQLTESWSLQLNGFGRFVDFEQFNDGFAEPDALGLTEINSGGATLQLTHRRGGDLFATVGAEYVHNDVDIEIRELPNEQFPDLEPGTTELVGTDEDNLGVYSELWWALTERFSAHGSLRFDHVNLPFKDFLDPSQSGDNEFNQLTGTAGIDFFDAESGFGAYANYGRGFRAPVILELTCADPEDPCPLPFELGADPPLDPVKTDTWQLGLRYRRDRLSSELTGYWSEVYDDLFNVIDPETPTRGFFKNLDRTRRQGIELSLRALARNDLTLDGSFAWTRATFQTDAALAAGFLEEEEEGGVGGGEVEEGPQRPPPVVQPGDRLAMVPEFTFSLGAEYSPSDWTVRLDGRFVGPMFPVGDENNTEDFGKVDGHFLLDGYVERDIGPLSLYLRGQNLLDSEYETFGVISENPRAVEGADEIELFLTPGYPFRLFGGISYRFR